MGHMKEVYATYERIKNHHEVYRPDEPHPTDEEMREEAIRQHLEDQRFRAFSEHESEVNRELKEEKLGRKTRIRKHLSEHARKVRERHKD